MTPRNAFISYRREDTAGYAGRIYDRLNARFPNRVFMDVSRLDPGVDFVEEIQNAVGSCKVLIVLIGKYWAVSSEGTPRLQDPNDFVRLEVGHALQRKIRVIPILVGGASIPSAESLPPEIGALLRRQVLKLDDSAFDYNVNQLIGVLEKELGPAKADESTHRSDSDAREFRESPPRREEPRTVYVPQPAPAPRKSRKWLWIGGGAVAVIWFVLAVIGALIEEFSTPIDPAATAAIMNAIQAGAQSGANPPQNRASSAPSGGAPAVRDEDSEDTATRFEPEVETFNPVGRWRLALGEGVSLLLQFNRDLTFNVETQGPGFSYLGSTGTWTYDSSERTLVATGINNAGGFFQAIFQNIQPDGDRYHALMVGQGNVVLTKE